MKILFVDDEKTTFEILKETIDWTNLNCTIFYNNSAKQTLEQLKKELVDIIIVDIEMPEMNGLEFIECIQAENLDTEIIILSAYSKFEYAQQAVRLGVYSYLLKPAKEKEVIDLIQSLSSKIEKKKKIQTERNIFLQHQSENIFRRIIETKGLYSVEEDLPPHQIVLFKLQEENYNTFWKLDRDKRQFLVNIEKLLLRFFDTNDISIFECSLERISFVLFNNEQQPYQNKELASLKTSIENLQSSQVFAYYSDIILKTEDFYTEYQKLKNMIDNPDEYEKESNTTNYHETIIQKATEFIQKEYANDITLEQISTHCAISKHYFCAIFKKNVGISIWDYLTKIRIEFSKQYLEVTDLKSGDIAEKVGYEDPAYFTRIFKKKTGITPSEYRKKYSLK